MKFYNAYFRVSKHEKIREQVMLARVAITTVVMILCLIAISATAYAYFSYNVSSAANVIRSANFEAAVTITPGEDTPVAQELSNSSGVYKAKLSAGEYTVTLKRAGSSTAQTGFCIVSAEKWEPVYHTQQIGRDGTSITPEVTFTLWVNAETTLTIRSHWGTSSHYADYQNKGDQDSLYITNDDDPFFWDIADTGVMSDGEEEEEGEEESSEEASEEIPEVSAEESSAESRAESSVEEAESSDEAVSSSEETVSSEEVSVEAPPTEESSIAEPESSTE